MKLLLLDDDGTVLDSTDPFTRQELDDLTPLAAALLLRDLNPDAS